jgi:hypothetical protein
MSELQQCHRSATVTTAYCVTTTHTAAGAADATLEQKEKERGEQKDMGIDLSCCFYTTCDEGCGHMQ